MKNKYSFPLDYPHWASWQQASKSYFLIQYKYVKFATNVNRQFLFDDLSSVDRNHNDYAGSEILAQHWLYHQIQKQTSITFQTKVLLFISR